MSKPDPDLIASERAAKIAWELALGRVFTTQQAADYLGISYSWARRLLNQISRVVQLGFDDSRSELEGYWYSTQHYQELPIH